MNVEKCCKKIFSHMRLGMSHLAASVFSYLLCGCAILPFYTSYNEPLDPGSEVATTAADLPSHKSDFRDDLFVGIALSGGGSRAANFSAAVLFELERFGLLPDHVTAISSVSGSSLTAAYYALFRKDQNKWNIARLKELLKTDFESKWIWRIFWPQNLFLATFTDYDRSNTMAEVFDEVLFDGKTFATMPKDGPRILLNASYLGTGHLDYQFFSEARPFVFTDSAFKGLRSRLDTYPVSQAVMASAAFPGAFHNITLTNHSYERETPQYGQKAGERYLHVFDAGPQDNLGISTLLWIAKKSSRNFRGCFIVVVDAHSTAPSAFFYGGQLRDTRKGFDYIMDRNFLYASDWLLANDRKRLLLRLGIDTPVFGTFRDATLFYDVKALHPGADTVQCGVWVLSFDFLQSQTLHGSISGESILAKNQHGVGDCYRAPSVRSSNILVHDEYYEDPATLCRVVNKIETRFYLTGPEELTPTQIQRALFQAANAVVWDDIAGRLLTCEWFKNRNISLRGCADFQ